jgi:uncharacterized protein YjiS (DUF1127 family)
MEVIMTILAKFRQAVRRRQAVRQLRALPPEILTDIGIEPDRIHEAVTGMLKASGQAEERAQVPRSAAYPQPKPDALLFNSAAFSDATRPGHGQCCAA